MSGAWLPVGRKGDAVVKYIWGNLWGVAISRPRYWLDGFWLYNYLKVVHMHYALFCTDDTLCDKL